MEGEVVYLFIYSVETNLNREQIKGLLKNPEDFSKYEYTKPTPEEMATFSTPYIFNLKDETLKLKDSSFKFKVQASIYETGTFSIRIRHPFTDADTGLLAKLAFDKEVNDLVKGIALKARSIVERNLSKVKNIKPAERSETYMLYYIKGEKRDILKKNEKVIIGLLIDEPDPNELDPSYIDEVAKKQISYNSSDVFYVGWEAAVMIDNVSSYEHELIITEIANVQLLQLMIFHEEVSKKIKDSDKLISEISAGRKGRSELKKLNYTLSEFYDSTRDMTTSVNDTISGFGEWYLLRLYSLFDDVLKISPIRKSIESDLGIIDKRRDFVSDEIRSSQSDLLEWIIVVLIIIEVVLEIGYLLK